MINNSLSVLFLLNSSSEKFAQRRAIERKEQYRQVRAHVRKEDGRLQAYGWSLPAKIPPIPLPETGNRSHVPVPVPVYCQPLAANDPVMKVRIFSLKKKFYFWNYIYNRKERIQIFRFGALLGLIYREEEPKMEDRL